MIQIKKGIPLPKSKTFGGRPGRYPFADMEVEDCFDIPVKAEEEADAVLRRMRVASASWRKRTNAACSFAVRVMEEDGLALVRVWKVAPRPAKAA